MIMSHICAVSRKNVAGRRAKKPLHIGVSLIRANPLRRRRGEREWRGGKSRAINLLSLR
jgi:hypothetical protein